MENEVITPNNTGIILDLHKCKPSDSNFDGVINTPQDTLLLENEEVHLKNYKIASKDISDITSPKENVIFGTDFDNPSSSKILENYKTPHSNKRNTQSTVRKDSDSLDTGEIIIRETPLPLMSWADSTEVWQNMIYKEEATSKMRNSKLFLERNSYLPRMRAILLDWIMEVCEVYHLRRVTYYLSVDYIDRYLTIKPIPKTQLQLLGISCLFIAAKLEEIYPPKLSEFSYVCDGACTEKEILACEVLLLTVLGWDVNPMTPTGWLNLYMQIHYNINNLTKQKLHEGVTSNFQFSQYSGYEFTKASHVIDLFSMDPGFLEFNYSIVAAAAMYYTFGKEVALKVSGLTWPQLEPCVNYMYVFHKVINEANDPRLLSIATQHFDERLNASIKALKKRNPFIIPDESHCLQTHIVDLEYFDKTTILRIQLCGNENYDNEKTPSADKDDEDTKKDDDVANEDSLCSDAEVIDKLEKILEEHLSSQNDLLCNEKALKDEQC